MEPHLQLHRQSTGKPGTVTRMEAQGGPGDRALTLQVDSGRAELNRKTSSQCPRPTWGGRNAV